MDNENTTYGEIDKQINRDLKEIKKLDEGSEEYKRTIEGITALRKLNLETEKLDVEYERESNHKEQEQKRLDFEREKFERELAQNAEIAAQEAKDRKIDRYVKIGEGVGSLLVPAILYGAITKKGFSFEETGIYTSTTMKNVLQSTTGWIRKFF